LTLQTIPQLGSFKLDISINALDGPRLTLVVREHLKTMPPLRYLVLALKAFLSTRGLNSAATGGLSSYAIICLAISYLHHNPTKRPVQYLEHPMEEESLGHLLIDLFGYYASTFPYQTSYVSVAQRALLPKETKGWQNPANSEALAIECLLNPDNDISKSASRIAVIRKAFQEAYETLRSYELTSANGNVLGSVIGIPKQTVEWRTHISDLVNSGELHQKLKEIRPPQSRRWTYNSRRDNKLRLQAPYAPSTFGRPRNGFNSTSMSDTLPKWPRGMRVEDDVGNRPFKRRR